MSNEQTVREVYAQFGRQNIEGITAHMAPNVSWELIGPQGLNPLFEPFHGHAGVREFFENLFANNEIQSFEPREFICNERQCAVVVHERTKINATGRSYESDWAHVWDFDADGRITRWRGFQNSGAVMLAAMPEQEGAAV